MEWVAELESRCKKQRHIRTMAITSLIVLVVLKSFWPTRIPSKFHCCQTPNGRVILGGRLFCPPSNIGVSQTLSKIGLKLLFLQNDFYVYNIFRPSTYHLLKLHQDIKKFYSFRIVFRNNFQFSKLWPKFFIFRHMKVPLEQALHTCHPFVKTNSGNRWQI